MHWFSYGIAILAATAIIVVGILYLSSPLAVAKSFGLPPPHGAAGIAWWLRLKGSRDVVSGLVVIALVAHGDSWILGVALSIFALIPLGDMTCVLAAHGSRRTAFGVHGSTAVVMLLGAVPLLTGRA